MGTSGVQTAKEGEHVGTSGIQTAKEGETTGDQLLHSENNRRSKIATVSNLPIKALHVLAMSQFLVLFRVC